MRIVSSYRGTERVFETPKSEVLFGRPDDKEHIDLDLSPDLKVSRRHGRIWEENGQFWIEDLNSSRGTLLSAVEIKGQGKRELKVGDVIQAGQTTLCVEALETRAPTNQTSYLETGTSLAAGEPHEEEAVAISQHVDATVAPSVPVEKATGGAKRRLKLLYELPLQFASKTRFDTLLLTIVDRLVEVIPQAARWALVLREPGTDALLLKAFHSAGQPSVSETLARRALNTRKGFIWKRRTEDAPSRSIVREQMESGMYVPLVWQEEALGVLCADHPGKEAAFTEMDLRLMLVVAQYAAMAVASHQMQEKLRRESIAMGNLKRQFSPKVVEHLLAHRGRLRLGGERSEVTILCSDVRGFTNLARDMEPDDVVEMLNQYFGALVPIVFAHRGTVDKYVGDSILAVFGSPEPDPQQHEQAVCAGLAMQAVVVELNTHRKTRGLPTCEMGIGIHCGEVVHGFIGTTDRMEFTVIGDAVNRAARYCSGANAREVIISPEMHERVWKQIEAEHVCIPTKHEGDFSAYRVKCLRCV